MVVARISLVRPTKGHEAEAEHLLAAFDEFVSKQPGYLGSFRFRNAEDASEVGRVGFWVSAEAANHVALLDHTQALRSRLHGIVEPGNVERLLDLTDISPALRQVLSVPQKQGGAD